MGTELGSMLVIWAKAAGKEVKRPTVNKEVHMLARRVEKGSEKKSSKDRNKIELNGRNERGDCMGDEVFEKMSRKSRS